MKKVELFYKDAVMQDIKNGATCEEIVKKYPVSMYYARKWSGDVFHKADLPHYVRDRYKWNVLNACMDIENQVYETLPESSDLANVEFTKCFEFIKQRMYTMLEEIVRKN